MQILKKLTESIKKGSLSIYDKLSEKEHDIESFLTDEKFRVRQLNILKKDLRNNAKKINEEVVLENNAIILLKRHSAGHKLTKREQKIVKTSLIDICKVVPSLGIFLLPGGLVLLPLVSKMLPFDLMPSAFQKKRKPKTRRKKLRHKTKRKNKRR